MEDWLLQHCSVGKLQDRFLTWVFLGGYRAECMTFITI